MKTASNLISDLKTRINQADRAYYDRAESIMPDHEYDELLDQLAQLESSHPELITADSPTQRVSERSTGFKKVKHAKPMLSLEKVNSVEALMKSFVAGYEVTVEPKIDGASVSLHYKSGKLVQAVTRGDGTIGDDVTDNVRQISTIPLQLPDLVDIVSNFTGEIRGEVFMRRSVFNKLNKQRAEEGEQLFANPRNAAAGSLKQKDPKETKARELSFVAYSIIGGSYRSQAYVLDLLSNLGFMTPYEMPVDGGIVDMVYTSGKAGADLKIFISTASKIRSNLDLDIDGLVIKIDSIEKQQELGNKTKSPAWAIAYKFPPSETTTTLNDITVQIGRTGTLTPVAELEPVLLDGSTISRASIHNIDIINNLGLSIGCKVSLIKANDIIPQIKAKVSGHGPVWTMPDKCPCCQTLVVRDAGYTAVYCPNYSCSEQVFQRLSHAASKGCLDMDGVGDATLREIIQHGVTNIAEMIAFKPPTCWTVHATETWNSAIQRAKAQPLWRKLNALGIPNCGTGTCKDLALKYGSIDKIAYAAFHVKDELVALLGPVKTRALSDYVCLNDEEISLMERAGLVFKDAPQTNGVASLAGKVFCITGALECGSRDDVAALIEKYGGVVKSSVSKKTDYLLSGIDGGANKARDAAKHGTKVISEADFVTMAGDKINELVVGAPISEREF